MSDRRHARKAGQGDAELLSERRRNARRRRRSTTFPRHASLIGLDRDGAAATWPLAKSAPPRAC